MRVCDPAASGYILSPVHPVPVQGWTTLMCAMLLISGVQLLCVGILGQYLARIYLEVKNRPVYLLKETDEEETENEG